MISVSHHHATIKPLRRLTNKATGGFHGGSGSSPAFRELLARWFFFGAFSPVFRMHGDRENGTDGSAVGAVQGSGGDNEVWSFGPQVYDVCARYLKLRELLRLSLIHI